MIPHLYAMDSQSKAEELASTILSSSSPPTISAACGAIEAFLERKTAEQSRFFFSIAFPALICKVFGFDDPAWLPSSSSTGWIDQVHASAEYDEDGIDLEAALLKLLSPSGALLSSISSVDRLSLVKYVFPAERLPEWARLMLRSEKGGRALGELCPLFRDRVKLGSVEGSFQLHLNVFEYFILWFAYYPVCRGNNAHNSKSNSNAAVVGKPRRSKLENWTSSITVLAGAGAGAATRQKAVFSLYTRLLSAYLHAFVPNHGSDRNLPYRSSLLRYSSGLDDSFLKQTEFFVHAFIQFWLVDNDFSPLPLNASQTAGLSLPLRVVLHNAPPTPGLGEVVGLFVKYLNSSLNARRNGSENAKYALSSPLRFSGYGDGMKSMAYVTHIPSSGTSGSPWSSLVQRPLYRFILRTFLFCPMGTSIKNASQIFSLWITYLEPWKISLEDFSELDALNDKFGASKRNSKNSSQTNKNEKDKCESVYTSAWEGYVLYNYLYYSSLVMHFLGFAHKFLHVNPGAIIQMVLKVLNVLTSSMELVQLMKKVDNAFHSRPSVPSSPRLDGLYKFVPSIREQLKDWEEGLCETDADGSFLPENWNQDLRLLNEGTDGGHHLLQLLVLRAESEVHAMSGNNLAENLQALDSLKAQMSRLFGDSFKKPTLFASDQQCQYKRDDIFKPRRAGNQMLEVKYKGDWMRRPISNDEVAWLTRLLVQLSDWLNRILGLSQGPSNHRSHTWTYVDLPSDAIEKVGGPKEAIKVLLCSLGTWFLVLVFAVMRFMREHGMRVNLRGLASKKLVMIFLLFGVFIVLRNIMGLHIC
ncbi:hypothetical protein Sjap_020182 [Stephania japonica]|uniref:Sphingomyelin phosphodiesterase 4 n=1 Tax=Stephania japonica TaxID=461633 RepID=A0AAP0HVD8_9MAGN